MARYPIPALALCCALLIACSFDWDPFDPRLATSTTSAPGGAGGSGTGGTGGQPRCGDGTLDADEQCDDSNLEAGDGCNPGCDVECGFLFNTETHHCYALLDMVSVNWVAARDECRLIAASYDLAAVSSQSEHDWLASRNPIAAYLEDNTNSAVLWLGGTDAEAEDVWVWGNGEPFFSNWLAGEPSDGLSAGGSGGAGGNGGGEDCAVYQRRDGVVGYDDRPCDRDYAALCELRPAGTPR